MFNWLQKKDWKNSEAHLLRSHRGTTAGMGHHRMQSREYEFQIPAGMTPGPAVLRSTSEWRCNPLRSHLDAHELPFEVVPG